MTTNDNKYRSLFDIPDDVAYLNAAGNCPQLRAVTEAGYRAVEIKRQPWSISDNEWNGQPEKLRSLIAQLLETETDSVALIPSASYGLSIAAANVPLAEGQTIIVLDEQFPSNIYPWRAAAKRVSGTLLTVTKAPDTSWTDAVLNAIDERTGVVALPQCHWTDGSLLDLATISAKVHSVGASFVIDASQTLGVYPINLNNIQPDFLVSVGYKWVLGQYSLAYLYAAPKWQREGLPIEYARDRVVPPDANGVAYSEVYRSGARRYDMGEYSQFIHVPMAITGIEQVLAWRVPIIQDRLSSLTAQIATGAQSLGYTVPADHVGHIIGLRKKGGIPDGLIDFLAERNVHVGARGTAVRVSPYMHNTEADVDRLIDALHEFQIG